MAEGKNLVGVDIGASAIKVVQLKENRKRLTVVRYGYATLPPQTIVDGHVMNAGIITEALLKIFTDQKISQKDVAIGVYGQSVIVRKITVPMMTPARSGSPARASIPPASATASAAATAANCVNGSTRRTSFGP